MHNTLRIQKLFEQSLPLFNALGNPLRQQLIMLMIDGEKKSVAELAASTRVARPTVSHHLRILKDAHILSEEKIGTRTYYQPQLGDYFLPLKELITLVASLDTQTHKGDT